MTKVVTAISTYKPPERISAVPATCPAEVRFVIEMSSATHTGRPPCVAIMPKAKETLI